MKTALLLTSASLLTLFGSTAYAADLIVEGPGPIQYADPAPSNNWDGAYVGVFAGYGQATITEDEADDFLFDTGDSFDFGGALLGVTAGANFTAGTFVLGVAGDVAWSNMSGTYTDITGDTFADIDWTASLRGRVGYDAGSFLPYLTAGLAVASLTLEDDPDPSETSVFYGWTVGAGVEIAVAENVSVDLAYRYSDYGSGEYELGFTPFDVQLTSHQVTAGINLGF